MKQLKSYIIISLLFSGIFVSAQNSFDKVLAEIEINNKVLKAAQQSSEVQKLDARTGIYLPDPSVEYERMWGNEAANRGIESELKVIQEFDFPTAYYQRNKIVNLKSSQADVQYQIARQEILLETKLLCVELVYLNKLKNILGHRLKNADDLNISYKKRLEIGDANVLEANKIGLELLNMQTEYRLNEVEINNRLQKLSELNGGVSVLFSDTSYFDIPAFINFDAILQRSLEINPELNNLRKQGEIAEKSVSLAKSLRLPKLSLGYQMNMTGPEKFYGLNAGISIPLWENKNTVKRARAEVVLAGMEIENASLEQTNELKQLHEKIIALQKSNEEYKKLLSTQNNERLLSKALSLGQISLLEYLTEVNFLYQSTENFLQTERDYYLAVSQFLKAEL